jgi:hypothetical protein
MLMEDEQVLRREFRNERLARGNMVLTGRTHPRGLALAQDDLPYKQLIPQIAEELNEGLLAKPAVRLQLPRAYLRLTQPSAGLHGQAQQGARCQALRGTPERT